MPYLDLTADDVTGMLRIIRPYPPDDGEALPWELMHDLRKLVECDVLSAYGQDTPGWTSFANQELPRVELGSAGPALEQAFWAHYWDSWCSHPDRTGDAVTVLMDSDFGAQRALHATGMYVDFDRPVGVEHEMMVCLSAGPPGRTLRLLFSRGAGPAFTERDRAVLALLRPHLQAAYVAAERARRGTGPLTIRQREIVEYVAAGCSNAQIARRLRLSEATVRKHLENVFVRLDVTSRAAAVARVGSAALDGRLAAS